jgi:hypothetical protein
VDEAQVRLTEDIRRGHGAILTGAGNLAQGTANFRQATLEAASNFEVQRSFGAREDSGSTETTVPMQCRRQYPPQTTPDQQLNVG